MQTPVAVKLALALAIAIIAGAARAQSADDVATFRAHCGIDYVRFCADMSPDGSDVRACFERNRAKLSEKCGAVIGAYEARQASVPASR